MKPLHAVSTLKAGTAADSRGAAAAARRSWGTRRSGVVVPKTMRSISAGATPGGREARARGVLGQIDGGLAVGGDVPPLDAGACRGSTHRWYPSSFSDRDWSRSFPAGRLPVPAIREYISCPSLQPARPARCARQRSRRAAERGQCHRPRESRHRRRGRGFLPRSRQGPPCRRRCSDADPGPAASASQRPGAPARPASRLPVRRANSCRMRSAMQAGASPSMVFRATLPVKPSVTTTSTSPGEDVIALDEADVVERRSRRAARAPPARFRAP